MKAVAAFVRNYPDVGLTVGSSHHNFLQSSKAYATKLVQISKTLENKFRHCVASLAISDQLQIPILNGKQETTKQEKFYRKKFLTMNVVSWIRSS